MEKIIIAAVSKNWVIGKEGKIPWFSKEEITFFKETTMGFPIIMGRKTFETIGKPLRGRINIVVTRNPDLSSINDGFTSFSELSEAVNYCELTLKTEKVFIIGGGEIFNEAIHFADQMSISIMPFNSDGDTFFPEIEHSTWYIENKIDYKEFQLNLFKRRSNK